MEVEGGRQAKWWAGLWWAFPLHQLLSTVGVSFFATCLTFVISHSSQARQILTETPYFPIQIGLAFFIGFLPPTHQRQRVMEWVWVLPFLVLCVCFSQTHIPLPMRIDHYFGRGCRPELRCFVQLAVTLPFYTSSAYSLAAFLSRKFRKRTLMILSP